LSPNPSEAPSEPPAEGAAEDESGARAQTPELSRDMTLFHVVMIGVGAMIGAGIFVLTGTAAGMAGPALVVAFALNGFIALLTAMSYAELGSCFPEAGGGYLWVKEGLPQPAGFLSGWMSWFAHGVACSLYALAFGAFVCEILAMAGVPLGEGLSHSLAVKGSAVLVVVVFTWINFRGAGETGSVEALVTIAKIVVIAAFLVTGILAVVKTTPASLERFGDFLPRGFSGVLVAMGFTFIAFEGYEIIAQCGEEVKNPRRNIPRSIFISLAVVVPIYILVAAVAIGAVHVPEGSNLLPWQYLGEKGELAMIEAADNFMFAKGLGAVVFLIGGIFSTMSALNATVYSTSRVSFAMGRDRNLPAVFGRIHSRRRTPAAALLISGIMIVAMAVSLPIEDVASATDVMFLFLFMFVNLAVINLRRHRPDLDRGFRVPLVPWIPLLAVGLNMLIAVFLFAHYPSGIPVVGGYIAVGVVVYMLYARRQEIATFALRTLFQTPPKVVPDQEKILVPIANPKSTPGLMRLARVLARDCEGRIIALNAVGLPPQTPLSHGAELLDEARRILSDARKIRLPKAVEKCIGGRQPDILEVVKVCHHVPSAIVETVRERKAHMVVLGWRGKTRRRDYFFGNILDETVMNVTCDVVMLSHPDKDFLGGTTRVIAPFISASNSVLSFRIALAVARAAGAEAVFLHVYPPEIPDSQEDVEKRLREEIERELPRGEGDFTVKVVAGRNPEGAIQLEKKKGHLLVLGASQEGLFRRAFFGDIPEAIAGSTQSPVILVKRYPGQVKSWFQQLFGSRRPQLPKA
jgi:amino acid transporter/nucleotide-binding universal stress UspA family protein